MNAPTACLFHVQPHPPAICVFSHRGRILAAEGYDPIKQQTFYRPLGGGIEFGEHSTETLHRELREEIGAEITDLRYLGALENLFSFNGQQGHEIVLVYDGAFVDAALYEREGIEGEDGIPRSRCLAFHGTTFCNNMRRYHDAPMQPWKTKSRRTLFTQHPWITLEQHEVELPDGHVIPDWTWVITPDFVNVAAVTDDNRFLCFRQVKYAVKEGTSLATVGGYLEPGEDPHDCAQRELLEETGYAAREWINLGSYAIDGNRGAGTGHLWLATGARKVAEINADDLEEQELLLLPRREIERALGAGEFKLMPWSACMALTLLRLNSPLPKGERQGEGDR